MLYDAESGDLPLAERTGDSAQAGDGRLVSLAGAGRNPDRPRPPGSSELHSAGASWRPTSPCWKDTARKTVGEVLEPSIHYAERGIPNYEYMLERIDGPGTRSQWDEYPPGGTDVFYDDGRVPEPGSILVQKSLGLILRKLVEAESAAPGHRVDGVARGPRLLLHTAR